MTVIEYAPDQDAILDYVNDAIRRLQEDGVEPKYILLGPVAYERMCEAMGHRFRRQAGTFETYNFFPIVVDPFRNDTVCVLPAPVEVARGVHAVRMDR